MVGLAAEGTDPKTIMIDAMYLKAHRTACILRAKRGARSPNQPNKRRYQYQAAHRHRCENRPIQSYLSAGPVSDDTGAAALPDSMPRADWFLADRGYDADCLRKALQDKAIKACLPGRKSRQKTVKYDRRRYERRNRIKIMFGRLKDRRPVATRCDRCPVTYLFAIALAATVLFWL